MDHRNGPFPPVAARATVYGRPAMASGRVVGVVIASGMDGASEADRASLLPAGAMSTALGRRAMITMASNRIKRSAPVSFVTTTATNESSPDPPNSTPELPPRRLRRMRRSPLLSLFDHLRWSVRDVDVLRGSERIAAGARGRAPG